jgi:hypothetical protein
MTARTAVALVIAVSMAGIGVGIGDGIPRGTVPIVMMVMAMMRPALLLGAGPLATVVAPTRENADPLKLLHEFLIVHCHGVSPLPRFPEPDLGLGISIRFLIDSSIPHRWRSIDKVPY